MSVWTNDDLEFLKENYNKYTKKQLAQMLDKTTNAIQVKASRLGLKREEKYFYDKNFFEHIDTEGKAYWLGFIYADGYISWSKKNRGYVVGIELQDSDYKHLEKFNKCIGGNVQVVHRKRKDVEICGVPVGDCTICSIRLFCKKMFDDLVSHGCCMNKTSIKDAPVGVPENLLKDFLRGYFDGNGTITYSYSKRVDKSYIKLFFTTGSEKFAKWLNETTKKLGFNSYVGKNNENSYKVYVSEYDVVDFLNFMYKDSNIYLQRKYEKFIDAVYGRGSVIDHKLSGGEIGERLSA